MSISFIAAVGRNGELGAEGHLPWDTIQEDMDMFRNTTRGHTIIMGRKTFESIGHPLPKRTNIILTKNPDYFAEGCVVVHSIEDALSTVSLEEEVFVIGGAEVYSQFLPLARKIYLTRVDAEFKADTFFPKIDWSNWRVAREISGQSKEREPRFSFLVYERKDY